MKVATFRSWLHGPRRVQRAAEFVVLGFTAACIVASLIHDAITED